MGDLAVDTAIEPLGDDRYQATLSREWAVWGPNGGYLASIALRKSSIVSRKSKITSPPIPSNTPAPIPANPCYIRPPTG